MAVRYQLRRRLGQGGMAEVFAATATGERGFTRTVAIKRMLPEIGRAHEDMFLDEARIASHLHHANIVAVLEYGMADQRPFQVLEFIDGIDLQSAVELGKQRGAPISVEVALHVCTEVAHALQHAHQARGPDGQALGIVHRDVKPANILVSYDGDVKLGDFGIAFARDRLQRTEVGVAKGTREYMSPEQWIGGEVDGRSDIFSLGCVLCSLLTGDSLMGPTRAQELLEGQELALSASLPADIGPIVARATRRQKKDRYASAAEMAEAMGQVLSRRVERQPKTLMREWMSSLRPLARTDEPLRIDLALDSTINDVKQFSTRAPAPPRRKSLVAALVGIGIAGAAATAVLVARWPKQETVKQEPLKQEPAKQEPAKQEPVKQEPVKQEPLKQEPVKQEPLKQEPVKQEPVRPEPAKAIMTVKASPRRRSLPAPVAPAPAPPAPPPSGTGHLLVSGEGAFRAEILIDGHSFGSAPRDLELPVGAHEVELKLGNGSHVRRRLEVAESNTPSSPARWFVP